MRSNRIINVIIVVLVSVFAMHQFYSSVYKPIKTENVNFYEAVDGLNITGIILRNEYLVTCDTEGVYHYLIEDGHRVAKGGQIANIYDSESASITMSEIDRLNGQIKDINDLQNYNNQQAVDIKLINSKVNSAFNSLINASSNGNYNNLAQCEYELLSALNRRRMITGEQTDFTAGLAALNEKLTVLKAKLPTPKGVINATESGYFSSNTDGYEDILTCDDLSAITVDLLNNLTPRKLPSNVIGKVVSDYEWYIAAKVSINDSLKYKVGDNLKIRTQIRSNPELSVKVAQINMNENGDSAVVIFSCDQMSQELASMRSGPMTVVNTVYSGLKVAKSALRVVDSQTGVYVVSGINLNFVKVEVIYSNDDYMICKQIKSNDEVLRLYDEVVVKGKKLYDGKIVD